MFEKFFEGFEFLWKRKGTKVCTFGPTLTLRFPLKMAKLKTTSCSNEKLQPLGHPNMSKPRLISSLLSGKSTITFHTIWTIFGRKQGGVTSQTVRIKIWHILFHPHNSWSTSSKKILVTSLSSFAAIGQTAGVKKLKKLDKLKELKIRNRRNRAN